MNGRSRRPQRPPVPDTPAALRARALRLLARREYSQHELQARLVHAGGAFDAVQAVLAELRAHGYLSDQRYAESAVRRQQGRFSRHYISESLRAQRVDQEVAAQALSGLEQDDFDTALALLRQRFDSPPRDDRERLRRVRFLQARGFSPGMALKVLRAAGPEGFPEAEPRDE